MQRKSLAKKSVLQFFSWLVLQSAFFPAGSLTAENQVIPETTAPFYKAEMIFPLEPWHNHASCLVELPNGDLLICWYNGSGEQEADDVKILGARKVKGETAWRPRFLMADTPNFPDLNPCMIIDPQKRLWLFWPVILANEFHTALMKYRISTDYQDPDRPPQWGWNDNMLFIPENFSQQTREAMDRYLVNKDLASVASQEFKRLREKASDKMFNRLGWMTRAHPTVLPTGRLIVPLYSDGWSFSLMAFSDDWGKTWSTSSPLVGAGNIQPSIALKKDGTLVAYMRDNGPPPKRLHMSSSSDQGLTWTPVVDTDLPNPGSGCEVMNLKEGLWALVYNDTEEGRHSLAVSISDDEGKRWKWTRHLELDPRAARPGSFHYPSIIQTRDGLLHVSYSYFLNHLPEGQPRKSIKHAAFNLAWVKEGNKDK